MSEFLLQPTIYWIIAGAILCVLIFDMISYVATLNGNGDYEETCKIINKFYALLILFTALFLPGQIASGGGISIYSVALILLGVLLFISTIVRSDYLIRRHIEELRELEEQGKIDSRYIQSAEKYRKQKFC